MKAAKLFFILLCLAALIAPAAAAGGAGTAANPYVIQTPAELQSISNNLAAYYVLGNDIDLSGVTWTPIGSISAPFTGQLDGNGYTISNLILSSSSSYTGFISTATSGATVKDVVFSDCSVTSQYTSVGIVIGHSLGGPDGKITISNVNCVNCNVKSLASTAVGCLIGGCYSSSIVDIINCSVLSCHISSDKLNSVGGLVGESGDSTLTFDSSTVQNSIIQTPLSNSAAGIIGQTYSSAYTNILNCVVMNCIIKANNYASGICSMIWGESLTVSNCQVTDCTIIVESNYAGGITGRISSGKTGIFSNCIVTDCTILASSYAATICPAFS